MTGIRKIKAPASLFYDLNGNMTSDGTHSYTWDARNRLTQMDLGNTASFSYDTFSRRTSKTILSTQTGFLFDGNEPAIFSDPTGLDYNVNYDPNSNTLNVDATVGIWGPYANNQLADSWQRSTNEYWNAGNWNYGKCHVRFRFKFNYLPNFNPAWNLGPQNLIFAEPDTMPFDIQGFTRTNYGYWSRNMLPWDAAHEMGHLLFLPDDYGLLSFGDHSGHMMSSDPVRQVVQHEVDDVLAGRGCGCK